MTMKNERARDFDSRVGAIIRERRLLLGITQQELARAIDITYQQVHKYEHGKNRVSVWHLQNIARALRMQPGEFFLPVDTELPARQRMMLELSRNIGALDSAQREMVAALVRSLLANSVVPDKAA